jgi:GT2 family glycosyltransferase
MFDENYKMYCEDVDLSLKISNNGGQIAYIPNSKVWHHVSMSLGGSNSYSKWSKKQLSILRLILKHGRLILLPISIISYFINASLSFMFISILKITKKR